MTGSQTKPTRYPQIEVGGAPFEMGRQIGEAARAQIRGFAQIALDRVNLSMKVSRENAMSVADAAFSFVADYAPHMLDELRGMAQGSGVTCVLDLDALPIFDEALACYERGVTTGANAANRELVAPYARFARELPASREEILFDPQTSGGLLAAVPEDQAERLVAALRDAGVEAARQVGRVTPRDGALSLVFE